MSLQPDLINQWSYIQLIKNFAKSNQAKQRVVELYDKYKKDGGRKHDKEIESWRGL